ncbi:MAG: biotin transporter BioY [Oscillospiraceae bacterium]|nr:biotin transporter BioY [Oscillospiraceae bacterium]
MTLCAFFAALTAVCAWIGIPLGDTVFTLQTLAVFLALGLLGGKWGTAAIGCYLLLGAVGVPVFSGFRGGIGHLLSPTGGFLWGFLFTGLCWQAVEKFGKIPAMVLGQLACYACGALWYVQYSGGGLGLVVLQTIAPYLIPDIFKLILAYRLIQKLKKRL